MRALFLVSDGNWSARARAFVLAARGLRARGHDVALACASDCPVQVRAVTSDLPVVSLKAAASATGSTMQIRRALKERDFDAVFVHTDGELLMASSAVRLGRGGGRVIRRVPPFSTFVESRGARFANRLAPTGLLFATDADRSRADDKRHRLPAVLAPLAVDLDEHDRVEQATALLGAPANATIIGCVHDGVDRRKVLVLMRTIALLARRHPELHLVIVGGARQEELRMEGAALGVNACVTYLGARDDELSILRAAHVGWIAAEGDAAAFAALDFMSFGTPVIAERAPLTEHYVADGIAGVLLPSSESPAEMTTVVAVVTAFLAKQDRRIAMGKAGRARLDREFSYDAMIRGYEEAASPAARNPAQTVA
jgi:glycosyltransferase involved in cell wall biosynthesis